MVDAAALLDALLRTPAAAAVEERLFDVGDTLHAPHLIDIEVAQVLRRYAATAQIELGRCREALSVCSIFLYTAIRTVSCCRGLRHNLTAYDACRQSSSTRRGT